MLKKKSQAKLKQQKMTNWEKYSLAIYITEYLVSLIYEEL